MPARVWLLLLSLAVTGCATRDAYRPSPHNQALVQWQLAPPAQRAPRLFLVTVTVESFEWYADLTSWVHSQSLIDDACARWLQVPEERRFALHDPDRERLERLFTEELPHKLRDDDILLLYIGTHQLRDGRLLLADDTHLRGQDLAAWCDGLPAGRQILLADVCYGEKLETSAAFDSRLVRIYGSRAAEEAPEIRLDQSLRQVTRFFADTHALIHYDLGSHHQRYSLLGLMLVHAMRLELSTREDLQLHQLVRQMEGELARFNPLVRRIEIPRFAAVNLQPWTIAQPISTGPVTAGDLPRPKTLDDLLELPDEQIDVGLGNLLIGKQYDASVDVDQHLARLDEMAAVLRQRLGDERRPAQIVAIVNDYLFDDLQLQAQQAPYTTDFLLHELLATGKGRCSALVSLYLALGQRLGLPWRSACIPEHIYIRWDRQPDSPWQWPDDRKVLNIETTLRGIHMDESAYRAMHNWTLTPKGKAFYLRPLTARQTIGTLYSPLASALLKQGLLDEAAAASRQAIAINPNDAEAWNNLGMIRRQQDKAQLAIACYRTALEIHPLFAAVWNNLGTLQPKAKDRVRYYRQAVRLKPDLGEAWKNLAYALFDLGDYAEARACVTRCQELDYPIPARFLQALERREE